MLENSGDHENPYAQPRTRSKRGEPIISLSPELVKDIKIAIGAGGVGTVAGAALGLGYVLATHEGPYPDWKNEAYQLIEFLKENKLSNETGLEEVDLYLAAFHKHNLDVGQRIGAVRIRILPSEIGADREWLEQQGLEEPQLVSPLDVSVDVFDVNGRRFSVSLHEDSVIDNPSDKRAATIGAVRKSLMAFEDIHSYDQQNNTWTTLENS